MADTTPIVLRSQPGIKRDGTKFDGEIYTDGQWVRFQRGLPRKMPGYKVLTRYLSEISRGFTNYTLNGQVLCHSGSENYLEKFTVDGSGTTSVVYDRTPSGYTASPKNLWMFDYMYDSSSSANTLIAHSAPNMDCICNSTGGEIFYGDLSGTTALTAVTLPAGANATGGVVVLHPYLFYYGSDGIIGWSVAGKPSDLTNTGSGTARVWSQKIIKGLPLRAGAGSAPAGIFWAYDAVIRATFSGGSTVFQFDIMATETSIMSPNSVVDYDGVFYWAGVDRFLMFNGVVREVPNQFNVNWFFDNLNQQQRQKVFAFKVPKFGEVWWCYPRGSATECTHAVIYNARENVWYDTELPNGGRSAGSFSNAFVAPLLTGIRQGTNGYNVWQHETGIDEIDGYSISPIKSYFETADISAVAKGQNSEMRIERIEPDFVQVGPMEVMVTGRMNARAPEVTSASVVFPAVANQPHEQVVVMKQQRRELRVRFTSNTLGGDYQTGQIIAHIGQGDESTIA